MKNQILYFLIIVLGLLVCTQSTESAIFCPPQLNNPLFSLDTGSIAAGKFRLHYRIEGSGIPTLVIGNSIYSSRIFSPTLRTQLRMVFLDHRGFVLPPVGRIDTTAFALDTLIEDMERARKFLKLGRIAVIGHSGHAYMALEYAKKYPQNVSYLIMIGISPDMSRANSIATEQKWRDSASSERKAVLKENLQRFPDSLLSRLSSSERFIRNNVRIGPMCWYNPHFDSSPLWEDLYVNSDMISYVWEKVFPRLDITKGLDKFDLPVFLALGRFDFLAPPTTAWDPLQTKFMDLTIRVFEHSGHTPPYEEAALFDKELLSWIGHYR
ncbi:MAG: alpha/beta hydrolase [Bacteroidetes bacterium]|nr:MAG: alpha/beta hydrolase [Bacteroidota bacterium]